MTMIWRIWLTAIVVLAVQGGALWVQSGTRPVEIAQPRRELNTIPVRLGPWKGTADDSLDERLLEKVGAQSALNRRYDGAAGTSVHAHVALFMDQNIWSSVNGATPHPPEMCYGGGGWNLVGTKRVEIPILGAAPRQANLLTVEREGRQAHVMYWYQLGKATYTHSNEVRAIRRNLWGKRKWPPVIKVLLHSDAPSADLAVADLSSVAELLGSAIEDLR